MMPYVDPDAANPKLVNELISIYEDSARRLQQIILHPPGSTAASQEFNQARAAQQLHQVAAEIDRLKKKAHEWTTGTMNDAYQKGLKKGDEQLAAAGVKSDHATGSFSLVDKHAVQVIANDTVGDLYKAADAMHRTATSALRGMSATGVTNAQVNKIIAGGIIEGKPVAAIRNLREELKKIHGGQVTIPTKSGGTITYKTGYYAKLVATSKTREATVQGRHIRLQSRGVDLVRIIGRPSLNPCTRLLGHIFSLSGDSGKYPAFSSVSEGQLPYKLFHPQCSKSTAPFIEGLSKVSAGRADQKEAA